MSYLQAVVLAVVEGITEFLPISSTGHMIITSSSMGIATEDFTKLFTVAIQFGAILSVLVLYWRQFIRSFDFYFKLLAAFLPAAVIGKLFHNVIDEMLGNVIVVAAALLLGGVVLLFVDRWFSNPDANNNEEIDYSSAFKIGLFQTIAMIPGVSRSAATIIGGLTQNLTKKAAVEFSFFLAVPTMFAATVYKLYGFYKMGYVLQPEQMKILGLGNLVAFLVALIAVKTFVGYLKEHGFRVFGYYRIGLGLMILGLHFWGFDLQLL